MSDSSVSITSGSGTAISTRTNASGEHLQVVMLGRDGNDGVLDPAALGDAVANPTTLLFGAAPLVWDGAQFVRQRAPVVFKTLDLGAGTAETTIWTPGGGKRFRWLGGVIFPGGNAKLTFRDGSGGSVILVMGGASNTPQALDLGALGILSAAANNALTVTRGTSATLAGTVWGTEE